MMMSNGHGHQALLLRLTGFGSIVQVAQRGEWLDPMVLVGHMAGIAGSWACAVIGRSIDGECGCDANDLACRGVRCGFLSELLLI